MIHKLNFWQIAGFVFTGLAGVLLHFLYDWSNRSIIVAPFSAVNESIWEHMKLLFFPMFTFALAEYKFIGKSCDNFWCATLTSIILGLLLIPIIYYTYTGIFGVDADWFNIAIFFIASGVAYYVGYLLLKNRIALFQSDIIAFVILCFIAVVFVVMTFVPLKIPLFQDTSKQ